MKIEDYVRPLWEDNNRDFRDNRRNKLQDKMFEIIAFIRARCTACLIFEEQIDDELPRFEDSLDENIELDPRLKSFPILFEPRAEEKCDRIDITENLLHVALFPAYVFLEFLRETLVFLEDTEIFLKRCEGPPCIDDYLTVGCFERVIHERAPFRSLIIDFILPLLDGIFEISDPLIEILGRYPWNTDIELFFLDREERETADKFVGSLHTRNRSFR